MEIKIKEVTIRDVSNGYKDEGENGVTGYGGLLNIRPAYQREFVYKDSQRDSVIKTILKGYPLNVMYWAKNADDTYELMDGQQRTISFCQFVNGDFSIREDDSGNIIYFHNLNNDEQDRFLSYKLFIYECNGSDKERLEWFRTINIAGEKLTDQELLNINYIGPWLASAKLRFSKYNSNYGERNKKILEQRIKIGYVKIENVGLSKEEYRKKYRNEYRKKNLEKLRKYDREYRKRKRSYKNQSTQTSMGNSNNISS